MSKSYEELGRRLGTKAVKACCTLFCYVVFAGVYVTLYKFRKSNIKASRRRD